MYEQWIAGYITAANSFRPKNVNVIDVDLMGLLFAVRKICEERPDELLVSATSRYVAKKWYPQDDNPPIFRRSDK